MSFMTSSEMAGTSVEVLDGGTRQTAADLMIWSDKYSVGVAAMDLEHHELFDGINHLHAAVASHEEREAIGPLLKAVADGTRAHFVSEEALMTEAKYSGVALHALKHQRLTEQVEAFQARFDRGFNLTEHSLIFLRDWFIPHILEADLNFSLWYSERRKY